MKSLEHSPCPAFIQQYKKLNTLYPMADKEKLKFYPIVNSLEWVKKLAQWGCGTIQLRLKNIPYSEIPEIALEAQKICQFYHCQFFLNDYWQLAVELNLFGVHLGFEDLQTADLKQIQKAKLHLGLSTHCHFELAIAIALNPSYIALGPIYKTSLKQMRFAEQGLNRITEWREFIPPQIPLVAIGGIALEHAAAVYGAGANSIAVVSDVTQSAEPEKRVKAWLT